MNNIHEISNLINSVFTLDEINQINAINAYKNDDKRYIELRKLFFTNVDIYNKVRVLADPAYIAYKIYILAKGHEF
jgi:hypothetical protein